MDPTTLPVLHEAIYRRFAGRGSVSPTAASPAMVTTADGLRLRSWLFDAVSPIADTAVLAVPGVGDGWRRMAPFCHQIARSGIPVLLVCFRGFAGNAGTVSEHATELDVRACNGWLGKTLGLDQSRIIYYGASLGAAVSLKHSIEYPPAGLVMQSPFIDLRRAVTARFPVLSLSRVFGSRYPALTSALHVDAPAIVVAGSADRVVPPQQSQAVAAALSNLVEYREIAGAGHDDLLASHREELLACILRLVRSAADESGSGET